MNELKDSELKECPFCGYDVTWCKNNTDIHRKGEDCHHITCERCGSFDLHIIDTDDWTRIYKSLADQWNTRNSIPISKLEELIERYEDLGVWGMSAEIIDDLKLIYEAKQ